MPSLSMYAHMANLAYLVSGKKDLEEIDKLPDWDEAQGNCRIEKGFNGARAATYVNYRTREMVIAIRGTETAADMASDAKIILATAPNSAGDIYKLVARVMKGASRFKLVLTGHSLGGGLAQLVGFWTGLPFVTFNAPGMAWVKAPSHINILKPQQMVRSWKANSSRDMSIGINYRLDGDFVSSTTTHIGLLITLKPAEKLKSAHAISSVEQVIAGKSIKNKDPMTEYGAWREYVWTSWHKHNYRKTIA